MIPPPNHNTAAVPALRVYLNLANLLDLRADSVWPGLDGLPRMQRLAADGFEGVQLIDDAPATPAAPIPHCGLDRINTPGEADAIAAKHAARGDQCLTVHAGWGLEDDAEVGRLVETILIASNKHGLPIFIETHRATITQDLWRTVKITERFPEVRFNGDFSHYYTGQELVYGGMEMKLAFMEPIFARTGFIHGRIGSPGCMQVAIGAGNERPPLAHGVADFLADFKAMWTRAMLGFLRFAVPGEFLIFAPELLAGTYYYARLFPGATGRLTEESDRYQEALLYQRIARECFAATLQTLAEG
ncbi:MAG: hypothetical protein NTW21_19515 [Verrucomicrobia bacterium]|nr:hypothetical protein [Verrucomicrobiota bacterium]